MRNVSRLRPSEKKRYGSPVFSHPRRKTSLLLSSARQISSTPLSLSACPLRPTVGLVKSTEGFFAFFLFQVSNITISFFKSYFLKKRSCIPWLHMNLTPQKLKEGCAMGRCEGGDGEPIVSPSPSLTPYSSHPSPLRTYSHPHTHPAFPSPNQPD